MRFKLLVLLAVLAAPAEAYDPPQTARRVFNFNGDWVMYAGDPQAPAAAVESNWERTTLPRTWNEDDAFRLTIAEHTVGPAWYRKHFTMPADAAGKKVFIEFEGVRQAAYVYLNGEKIGLHENGAMAFGFDLTAKVKPAPAENVLEVATNNDWEYLEEATGTRYQWADRNFNANYGGINKHVKLHIADKLYQTLPLWANLQTTGVYVYASDFDIPGKSATITAESEVKNDHDDPRAFTYEVIVEDMDGKAIKTFESPATTINPGGTSAVKASAKVDGLNFWSWGYGYLYNVHTILKVDGKPVDAVKTRTGFRKTATRDGMFLLNDRVMHIKGYAQRTSNEWPGIGLPSAPWLSDYSNRLLVESNGNTVRWMHITPAKAEVESCDRVGLLMLMPAGDAEGDSRGRQWEQRAELMRDALIYNRNNPSVVFLEGGNESISEEHMAELKAIRDKYDPHGGRLAGCREMLASPVAEWGGEMLYVNKRATIPMMATEYSRDEGLRKYWDEFSPPFHKEGDGPLYRNARAPEYNRNQDTHAVEDVLRWFDFWEARPGTGKRVQAGGLNIIFSDTNTHSRGAENYRRSGEVDAMRIPKDGYWAHKAMWDGWVDVPPTGLHIMGHWNYTPEVKKDIQVVSSAPKVALFLNGKQLPEPQRSSHFLFTFPAVQWEPGTLKAVAYDSAGKETATFEHVTAGPPAELKLTAMGRPGGTLADGADLILAQIEVVDAQGRRCPTAFNMIDFTLAGPAEWRGGIAQGADNYILAKSLPVELGINRVLLRTTTQAGKIVLTAKSEGLPAATLEIESTAFDAAGGFAKLLPADGLPSYLGRGPTPVGGPQYTVTREPIAIARAVPGANPENAARMLDDNELSSWANDDRLATAWVRYEFEAESEINEIAVKFTGHRTARHAIRLLVDGKEVWSGQTRGSLGYVSIPFPAARGKSVTIALAGASTGADAFNIAELNGAADPAAQTAAAGQLGIIEFEAYKRVRTDDLTPLVAARP